MFSMLPSFVLWSQLPEKPLEDSQETGRLTKLFVLQQNKEHNSNQWTPWTKKFTFTFSVSVLHCAKHRGEREGNGGLQNYQHGNLQFSLHLKNHRQSPHFVSRESLFSRRGQCWLCRRKMLNNRWKVIFEGCDLFMSDVKFSCTFKNIQSKVYKDMGPHDSNLIPLRKLSLLSNLGSWQRNNRKRWKSIVIIIIIMDENLGS